MIDWQRVDTVLLDMDGTLLDLYFDNHFWQHHLPKRYAEQHGQHPAEALAYLEQRFRQEHGSLNWYCLDFWRDELQLDIVALKREISHLIAMRPHSEAFLTALRAAGKAVWLVTNAHPDSVALKFEHTALQQYLDRIISSHEIGVAKEHPDFWPALQARFPFQPARSLFVDDTESVLLAARQFGIGQLLFISAPDSRAPQRSSTNFTAIADFDEVLPIPTAHSAQGAPHA